MEAAVTRFIFEFRGCSFQKSGVVAGALKGLPKNYNFSYKSEKENNTEAKSGCAQRMENIRSNEFVCPDLNRSQELDWMYARRVDRGMRKTNLDSVLIQNNDVEFQNATTDSSTKKWNNVFIFQY
jgi:hypothetical protein